MAITRSRQMRTVLLLALLAMSTMFGIAQAATTIDVMIRPNPGDEYVYDAIKEGFEKAYPNIKINYISSPIADYFQKYTVMYAGGTAPDVIMPSTSWTVSYAMQDMLMPLDDLARQDKFNMSDIFPEVLNMYRVNGKVYGMPNDIAAMAFMYNEDLFAQNGITPPQLDWTTDEYVKIGRKLTADTNGDEKIDHFGVAGINNNMFLWTALGSNLFDSELYPKKFLLNSPAGYQGLQFLQDMRWKDHFIPRPGESADIYAGTAAMNVVGHWNLAVAVKQAKFNWNLLSIPRMKQSVQRADGSSWAITKTTKHLAEAWAFVKFMGYEGSLIEARNQFITPANRRVAASPEWRRIPNGPNITKEPFINGIDHSYNAYVLTHPKGNSVMDLVNKAINSVWNNTATPQQAVESVAPAVMELIQQLN